MTYPEREDADEAQPAINQSSAKAVADLTSAERLPANAHRYARPTKVSGIMTKPIGIFYEHPEWFKPLFATLDRRGLPYEPIRADQHRYDPSAQTSPFGLVIN